MKRSSGALGTIAIIVVGLAATAPRSYTLEGTIVDRTVGTPVVDASVSLVTARRSARTDANGAFSFGSARVTASDQLVISHPDYRTVRIPLGTLPSGDWRLDISLAREPIVLGGEEPEATRP